MANSRGRKLYRVTLSAQERRDLKAIVDGTGAAWRRAQVLMLRGRLSMPTLRKGWASARRRLSACASAAGAGRRPQPQGAGEPSAETGAMEAKLIALFVPARGLWTLKLLAGRLVEIVERISEETVRKTLKKEIKPWLNWCIPPHRSAQFVAADVLDIYQRDFAGDEVLEISRQQETRIPRSAGGGRL